MAVVFQYGLQVALGEYITAFVAVILLRWIQILCTESRKMLDLLRDEKAVSQHVLDNLRAIADNPPIDTL